MWHALRVTAGTALGTAKRPDGLVQAVIRWKTLEAMRLYNKTNRHQYADAVDDITTTAIDVTKAATLPALGPEAVADTLEAMEPWLLRSEAEGAQHFTRDGAAAEGAAVKKEKDSAPSGAQKKRQPAAGARAAAAGKAADKKVKVERDDGAEPAALTIDVCGVATAVRKSDAAGMVGTRVRVHNSLWPHSEGDQWDAGGTTICEVVGECVHPYAFSGGAKPCAAYVIRTTDDEAFYPVKANALRKMPKVA